MTGGNLLVGHDDDGGDGTDDGDEDLRHSVEGEEEEVGLLAEDLLSLIRRGQPW